MAELGWRWGRDAGHGGQQSTRGPVGILFSEQEEGFYTGRHRGHSDRGEILCWVPGGRGVGGYIRGLMELGDNSLKMRFEPGGDGGGGEKWTDWGIHFVESK